MITKGERTELRGVVRQQYRVLRAEVMQRQVELLADVEHDIHDRFAAGDKRWSDLQFAVNEAVLAANRQINDLLYEQGFEARSGSERMWLQAPNMNQPQADKYQLHRVATTRIAANVKAALLRLDRDEADLLRTLATSAIESEEARGFLASIPTVGELVPTARLAEIEASMGDTT